MLFYLPLPLFSLSSFPSIQLVFRRAVAEQLLSFTANSTAQTVSDVATKEGISFSARTAARVARDIRDAVNFGARDQQFKLLSSLAAAITNADPHATARVGVNHANEFVYFFVSWGFAKTAIMLVKPVVAIDGAHLSPQGTGTVRLFFWFFQALTNDRSSS